MKHLFAAVVLLGTCCCMYGQRTMPGQSALELRGAYNGSSFSAGIDYSMNLLPGWWSVGVGLDDYRGLLKNNSKVEYDHLYVRGTYMQRLAGTRDRAFCLYGGGGAFLGYEFIDPLQRLDPNVYTGLNDGYFLYGILAGARMEWFIFRQVALAASFEIPINFSSPISKFHWNAGLGVKVYI